MILAVDVHYKQKKAVISGVLFKNWRSEHPEKELISITDKVEDYESGQFYKRELPCILKLLNEHSLKIDAIVIDGFVYLDGFIKPGLGKHLYDALKGKVKIIGVAKNPFRSITDEFEIFRGRSQRPLFVTTAGLPLEKAKTIVSGMHGKHRIPTLLKRADQICRLHK
jgi:deoxyribonuclease V